MEVETQTSILDVSQTRQGDEPVVRVRIGAKGQAGSRNAHLTVVQAMTLARVLLQVATDISLATER